MFPNIVINQNTEGIMTKACIIFKDDGRYGLIISGKTDGAPINNKRARIETAIDSVM